jgi:hypothetical protein
VTKLRSRPDTVSDAQPSHLAYEETHPLEPFARSYSWPGCGGEATDHRVVHGLGEVIG